MKYFLITKTDHSAFYEKKEKKREKERKKLVKYQREFTVSIKQIE